MAHKDKPRQRQFARQAAYIGKVPRGGFFGHEEATKQGPMPRGLLGRAFGRKGPGLQEGTPESQRRLEQRLGHLGMPVRYKRMSERQAAQAPYVPVDEFRTFGGEHVRKLRPFEQARVRRRNR